MKTKDLILSIVPLLLLLLSFNVYAFGVTAFYWNEKPLYLNPGESREIQAFGLQNMVGGEDTTISVEQISGSEIAEITDKSLNYKVPYGSKDVYINMRVTIPPDAKIGQVYSVGLRFKESASEKEGASVQTVGGMTNSIEVVVGERIATSKIITEAPKEPIKEEQPTPTATQPQVRDYSVLGLMLTIIVILVIAIMTIRSYKRKVRK